jgi:hypothetical protein
MLEDHDYEEIQKIENDFVIWLQERKSHALDDEYIKRKELCSRKVYEKYYELSGKQKCSIQHHIVSRLGPTCKKCGKPYRTPEARYCAECGYNKEKITEQIYSADAKSVHG